MSTKTSPNAPCPCGSGQKFKNCCERRPSVEKFSGLSSPQARFLLIAAIALLVVGGYAFITREPAPEPAPAPRTVGNVPTMPPPAGANTAQPAPYQYDPVANRHWDPGHAHWHDGPPPPGAGTQPAAPPVPISEPTRTQPPAASAPTQGQTPPPYFYDEANNQHWDPGHGHWHPGKPPEGATAP